MDGGCTADRRRIRDGRPSAAQPPRLRRVSVVCPPHIRRMSVVCPLRSCRPGPSVVRPSKRLRIVGVSQYGQVVIVVAVDVASISRSRRIIVASSSRRSRIVVALSSHHRRIVGASSARRRRVVATSSSHRVRGPLSHRRRAVVVLSLS